MTIAGNNPGNIRFIEGVIWNGQTGSDERGFVQFDTMQNGIRALCKTLLAYEDKHDLHCIEDIINRWAPPSENNTQAYIDDVCARTHWRPDEYIDLKIKDNLVALASAISHHETGQLLDLVIVVEGATAALV